MAEPNEHSQSLPSSVFLTYVIARKQNAGNLDRLMPALYLAQQRLGIRLYSYRLAMGHVVSDELAQDIAQLSAAGIFDWSDAVRVRLADTFNGKLCADLGSADKLSSAVESLVDEEETTLDAAATCAFFTTEGFGDPSAQLSWFRTLPREVADRACEVAGIGTKGRK